MTCDFMESISVDSVDSVSLTYAWYCFHAIPKDAARWDRLSSRLILPWSHLGKIRNQNSWSEC